MKSTIQSKDQWHAELIAEGAQLDTHQNIHFHETHTDSTQAHCFYLQHLSCIEVSGADSFDFLQGQLSCDMSLINKKHSGIGTHNNLKGRMLSSFRVIQAADDTYYLIIDQSIALSCQEQLKKYAVFSKVTIEINESKLVLACHNTASALNISSELIYTVTHQENAQFIQVNNDASRLMIVTDINEIGSIWTQLLNTASTANVSAWNKANIEEGIAWVTQETQDAFLPQSLNYHLMDGVSFKKGCYIGQEVIIRTQHRGALKRHLCFMAVEKIHNAQALSIGKELYCDNKSIGIIAASNINNDSGVMLVVCHKDYIDIELQLTDELKMKLNISALTKLDTFAE